MQKVNEKLSMKLSLQKDKTNSLPKRIVAECVTALSFSLTMEGACHC